MDPGFRRDDNFWLKERPRHDRALAVGVLLLQRKPCPHPRRSALSRRTEIGAALFQKRASAFLRLVGPVVESQSLESERTDAADVLRVRIERALGMQALRLYYEGPESREGVDAFKEKRPPDWMKFRRPSP